MNITRRKALRRDVRRHLGTSSDAAPDTLQVLRAADALKALLDLTSGHAFGLAVFDFETRETMPIADAMRQVTEARERREAGRA